MQAASCPTGKIWLSAKGQFSNFLIRHVRSVMCRSKNYVFTIHIPSRCYTRKACDQINTVLCRNLTYSEVILPSPSQSSYPHCRKNSILLFFSLPTSRVCFARSSLPPQTQKTSTIAKDSKFRSQEWWASSLKANKGRRFHTQSITRHSTERILLLSGEAVSLFPSLQLSTDHWIKNVDALS